MTDGLTREWRTVVVDASDWEAGRDPSPVLEALSLTVALELTGALSRVPSAERDQLRRVGQRALLHLGAVEADDEELEALRIVAALARDGLRALSGRALPDSMESELDVRPLVPPSEVRRLVAGELDGFAAGSLALKIRRSAVALAELRAYSSLAHEGAFEGAADGRVLSLAAADRAAVRDPASGRLVGALEEHGAEAILFEGSPPRLAVYAEEPAALRLVGPGLVTEAVREGYWLGRIETDADRIEAMLHTGDFEVAWTIMLGASLP